MSNCSSAGADDRAVYGPPQHETDACGRPDAGRYGERTVGTETNPERARYTVRPHYVPGESTEVESASDDAPRATVTP